MRIQLRNLFIVANADALRFHAHRCEKPAREIHGACQNDEEASEAGLQGHGRLVPRASSRPRGGATAQLISEATILKYVLMLHRAIEIWEKAAIERLLTLPALRVEETSLRVDKKNQWIHVCSGGEITLKFLHEKRGQEAMQAIGVIPRYVG